MDPNVKDLIQLFPETSHTSLRELREREREEALNSTRPEDHSSHFTLESLSQNSQANTSSILPVKIALVNALPQTFRVSDSPNSAFLFVADTRVLAMSLSLRFPIDCTQAISAIISPQNLPFANLLLGNPSSSSHSPLKVPMHYSPLRLLFWDSRGQSASQILNYATTLLKTHLPTCFFLLISDPKIGNEVSHSLGIATSVTLTGHNYFPSMLFLWSDSCFFALTRLVGGTITISVHNTPRCLPTGTPETSSRQGEGPLQSSVNSPWLGMTDFVNYNHLVMAMGGPSKYRESKEGYLQRLSPRKRHFMSHLPQTLWTIGQRGHFIILDRLTKALSSSPWPQANHHTLSLAFVSDGQDVCRGGYTLRNPRHVWRLGFGSRLKGPSHSFFSLFLLQKGLQKARSLEVKRLEVMVDVNLFILALARLDVYLADVEQALCDILQLMCSSNWEVSIRHFPQDLLQGAKLIIEHIKRFSLSQAEVFETPPSAEIGLGPF